MVTESGRSHEEASSNPRPYSCLENSMDRGAWWAIVRGITKQLDIIERMSLGVKVEDGKGKTKTGEKKSRERLSEAGRLNHLHLMLFSTNICSQAPAGFKSIDSNFERRSTVGKMLSNSTACYKEIVCERKSPSTWQTSFKKLPQLPRPSATTTPISQQPSTLREDSLPIESL